MDSSPVFVICPYVGYSMSALRIVTTLVIIVTGLTYLSTYSDRSGILILYTDRVFLIYVAGYNVDSNYHLPADPSI